MTIGKHLATFNVFREPDGLYVTCADAAGVRDEIGDSGAPLHLCAFSALRVALRQMDAREALAKETRKGGDEVPSQDDSAGRNGNAQGGAA